MMDHPPTIAISEKDIIAFQNDGAICLRGVFDPKWIDSLRRGIEANRLHPSEMTKRKGHSPLFFHDYNNWSTIPEYKEFIFHSSVGEIVAKFLQSSVSHDETIIYIFSLVDPISVCDQISDPQCMTNVLTPDPKICCTAQSLILKKNADLLVQLACNPRNHRSSNPSVPCC